MIRYIKLRFNVGFRSYIEMELIKSRSRFIGFNAFKRKIKTLKELSEA